MSLAPPVATCTVCLSPEGTKRRIQNDATFEWPQGDHEVTVIEMFGDVWQAFRRSIPNAPRPSDRGSGEHGVHTILRFKRVMFTNS